jgi:hypothetical protein
MRKQTLVTLLHLATWSQLGVLTRTFVGKFFQLGCNGEWGPCIQGASQDLILKAFLPKNNENIISPPPLTAIF